MTNEYEMRRRIWGIAAGFIFLQRSFIAESFDQSPSNLNNKINTLEWPSVLMQRHSTVESVKSSHLLSESLVF